jgi:hypothetical protein
MKTALRVMMAALLFRMAGFAAAEGIDQEIVLIGNDESEMTLPALREQPWPSFPPVVVLRPKLRPLPPFLPPKAGWMDILADRYADRFFLRHFGQPLDPDALP